jgi:aquaporin Z
MRAVDIGVKNVSGSIAQMKASFRRNWKFYCQEALGLAIFMISACFFSGLLFGKDGYFNSGLSVSLRQSILGVMMGATALFIFYSRFTSPSGSHINPAVTLSFFRLGKIGPWDSLFYMIFQLLGGTLSVYLMAVLMKDNLTAAPLHFVITVPGKYGTIPAVITEFIIAFIMMFTVLFTSADRRLNKYTRLFSGILVCVFVIIAGPVSGFGMNPARSFSSAFPAQIWTGFWIYISMPLSGMLSASEVYLFIKRRKSMTDHQ